MPLFADAPDVHVNITGGSWSQVKDLTCWAEGRPSTYTFRPWVHSWGAQEVRRVTGSQQGGQSRLTLSSYQDSGTYLCSVDNGVLDAQGQMTHTASFNVTVEGMENFAFLSRVLPPNKTIITVSKSQILDLMK